MANLSCGGSTDGLRPGHSENETEDLRSGHPGNETKADITGQHGIEEQASCAGTFDVKVEKTDSLSPCLQTEDPDEAPLQNKTTDTGGQRDRGGRDSGEETFYWEVMKTGSSSQLEHGESNMPELNTEKPYMCGECGFRTKQKSDLSIHKRTHTSDKPYKCDQCDYSAEISTVWTFIWQTTPVTNPTRRKSSLNKHMTKHTGTKPYKGDQCDSEM
ncbi:zinc finger protein 180-like [Branchiostoma floridae]|uniref:Zinc finger protein 180-like n=1 Tax=Branchiostoma floridae TaxID=7739 RepID=A0A9J7HWL7_BRAFL|nr:zinc finger protein 180-like [Branchiostoma floridae]